MTYRIGELRERVTIRRSTETRDSLGSPVLTETDVATVWALVRPMSGRERQVGNTEAATAGYLFVFRQGVSAQHAISTTDALVWRGDSYDVTFVKSRGPAAHYTEVEAVRRA